MNRNIIITKDSVFKQEGQTEQTNDIKYKEILNCCSCLFSELEFDIRLYNFCKAVLLACECDKIGFYFEPKLNSVQFDNEEYLCFDVVIDNKLIGELVIECFNPKHRENIKNFVNELIPFLRTAIQNEMMQQKLSRMAYFDSLTGLYNRNSLIEKMKNLLCSDDEFGVIFFDVNGLKTVNDEQGHDAGDKLLIKAAEIISMICGKEHSYRFGGDEFVVIIEKDDNRFQSVVNTVKNTLDNSADLSISFGYSWSQDNNDKKDTFVLADKRMYAQKEAFYKKYPELKSLR